MSYRWRRKKIGTNKWSDWHDHIGDNNPINQLFETKDVTKVLLHTSYGYVYEYEQGE